MDDDGDGIPDHADKDRDSDGDGIADVGRYLFIYDTRQLLSCTIFMDRRKYLSDFKCII